MERSFKTEVAALSMGAGEEFHGEGILAVTKALLQSGVSYIGGYQGAPVSHLIDVLGDARELLDDLGIYFEPSASEAGAAAMLGALFILDDPIFNGLAISLIFGIFVSTILTLVVIPTLYYAAYRRQYEAV